MSILAWIVLGGLAGWIASMLMGTSGSQGLFLNIAVGIVGAMLGGTVFNFFGEAGVTGFNFYSLLVAVIGSALLIWIVKLVRN
ncbi:MAG: GlsB/YeaQ/YmgE family stress response membrane protein [Candidatus Paceibacteria bacterium]